MTCCCSLRADSHQLLAHRSNVDLDDLLLTEAARLGELHTHDITFAALEPLCIRADPAQLARSGRAAATR